MHLEFDVEYAFTRFLHFFFWKSTSFIIMLSRASFTTLQLVKIQCMKAGTSKNMHTWTELSVLSCAGVYKQLLQCSHRSSYNTTESRHVLNARSWCLLNARLTAFLFVMFSLLFIFSITQMCIECIPHISNYSKLDCEAKLVVCLSSRKPYFCKKRKCKQTCKVTMWYSMPDWLKVAWINKVVLWSNEKLLSEASILDTANGNES